LTARSWVVQHAKFDGDSIDRDSGYPDLELELHPMGILTEKPTFQLLVRIVNKTTILNYTTTQEMLSWLEEVTLEADHS
jgi:hypothetical protein